MTAKRAKLGIVLFLMGLLLAGIVAARLVPSLGAQRAAQVVRAAGLPLSGLELDRWYTNPPVGENAALIALAAANHLVEPGTNTFSVSLGASNSLSGDSEAAIAAYINKNRGVIEELHALNDLPASRYPLDATQLSTLFSRTSRG